MVHSLKTQWNYKLVKEYVKNLGFELLSTTYKRNEKLILQDSKGYIITPTLSNFKRGQFKNEFSKSNPYVFENIKLFLSKNNLNFKLVSNKFFGVHRQITLMTPEGYIITPEWLSFKSNFTGSKFHKTNPYTIQNIRLWCKLNNSPFELVSEKYYDCFKKLKWKCLNKECGEIFEANWANIQQKNGCGVCSGLQITLKNCLATKRPDLLLEWHSTKNEKITPYNVACGGKQKVWWKCKECGHEWNTTINNRTKPNGTGCPKCGFSKGERKISEFFDLNNVIYIPQKEFDGLVGVGKNNLSYDFYLPDFNLLIEYQGQQHEKYYKGFHKSKKDFEKQQEHDRRKREYANYNNIKLLEIWYWDFDNIEEILHKNILKKGVN